MRFTFVPLQAYKPVPYLLTIPSEIELPHGVLRAPVVAASEKQFRSRKSRVQLRGTAFEDDDENLRLYGVRAHPFPGSSPIDRRVFRLL